MTYEIYIRQYAPETFETVNIGIVITDGEKTISKSIDSTIADKFGEAFGQELPKIFTDTPSVWTSANWPDQDEFESMGYGMSTIKYHSNHPMTFSEPPGKPRPPLEEVGDYMFERYCIWPRDGIYDNMPEAVERTRKWLKKWDLLKIP